MTTPCGYQQITSMATAVGLTVPVAGSIVGQQQLPAKCIITPQTQAVRWRDDGVAPTATVGYPLAIGAELRYDGDLRRIQFIEQAASAVINVVFMY